MGIIGHKNSNKQGDAGLGIAIAWYTGNGYTVSIPLTDSQDYDLIVDNDGLKRVQVKTSITRKYEHRDDVWTVSLRTCGGNRRGPGPAKFKLFDIEKVDELFVITGDMLKYKIPTNIITVKSCITVGNKYRQYLV